MKKQADYGSWSSPITADLAAVSSCVLDEVQMEGDDIYWIERRPQENGRQVVMRWSSETGAQSMTPTGFSARTRVHEYGGGNYVVHKNSIYFFNDIDQCIYRQIGREKPDQITSVCNSKELRYADSVVLPNGQWLITIQETHTEVAIDNEIVLIAVDGKKAGKVLVSGSDFYAAPRLNKAGSQLAWISWNHPQMPWDGTELWMGDLTLSLELINVRRVAGGVGEFVSQPTFGPDGRLYFISDRGGFGNIYSYHVGNGKIKSVCTIDADCDYPQWVFRIKTYDFFDDGRIVVIVTRNGRQTLSLIEEGKYSAFDLPFTDFMPTLAVKDDKIIFIGARYDQFPALVEYNLRSRKYSFLHESSFLKINKKYISSPKAIEYPTDNGKTAHAFYYAPHNEDYLLPKDKKPPLIVISHGGPTSATSTALNLKNQFWTSRGFAVLDVNYGGSTGYGKAYRERLKGQWGVVDVADCVNGAKFLVKEGKVDPKKLIIRGGSAGGYTVFCALTAYDVFSIGSSYFGVADLTSFLDETHKFESHYLETLIGPYPEKKDLYKERSPINHADQLSCPIIFLQGLEDKVVPPSQAEIMIAAMNKKGIPYSYVTFTHERHGFRNAKNIKIALESELYFFSRFFHFEPADSLIPIKIENFVLEGFVN